VSVRVAEPRPSSNHCELKAAGVMRDVVQRSSENRQRLPGRESISLAETRETFPSESCYRSLTRVALLKAGILLFGLKTILSSRPSELRAVARRRCQGCCKHPKGLALTVASTVGRLCRNGTRRDVSNTMVFFQ
jgi:hypothetical protein